MCDALFERKLKLWDKDLEFNFEGLKLYVSCHVAQAIGDTPIPEFVEEMDRSIGLGIENVSSTVCEINQCLMADNAPSLELLQRIAIFTGKKITIEIWPSIEAGRAELKERAEK